MNDREMQKQTFVSISSKYKANCLTLFNLLIRVEKQDIACRDPVSINRSLMLLSPIISMTILQSKPVLHLYDEVKIMNPVG